MSRDSIVSIDEASLKKNLRGLVRRTVEDTFPDGRSALMLVAACLKYVVESEWSSRRYLDTSLLD